MKNGKTLKKNHDRLRFWYYFEVSLGLTLLFTYLLAILSVFIVSLNTTIKFDTILYWMLGGAFLLFLLLVIVLPIRARSYQRKLLLRTYEELSNYGIKLIPFFLKGKQRVTPELLSEVGIKTRGDYLGSVTYELDGRLFNVLHYHQKGKVYSIIHLPRRENPYYLQINNGNFSELKIYKGIEINKLYYVSPHNLNYFATSGPPNVNIYLRANLEKRFLKLLDTFPLTYQYIITYTDEFLLIKPWYGVLPLRLSAKYSVEYYERIYNNLLSLQVVLGVMLEKGN